MSENHSKLPYNLITAAYQGDVKTAIAQLAEGADVMRATATATRHLRLPPNEATSNW